MKYKGITKGRLIFYGFYFTFIGNYSRLAIEIQFVRSSGFYILSGIIPMILLVILSFVSFLLTTDSKVMKLGIPVCSFLGVLFLMVSINIGLPKISYVKAIDAHSLLCTAVVFLVVVGKHIQTTFSHFYLITKRTTTFASTKDLSQILFNRKCRIVISRAHIWQQSRKH